MTVSHDKFKKFSSNFIKRITKKNNIIFDITGILSRNIVSKALMKTDLDKFQKLQICVLSTYGHCGVDWITSLLDNHEEVLIMPS